MERRLNVLVLLTLMTYMQNTIAILSEQPDCPYYCFCQFDPDPYINFTTTDCSERNLMSIPHEGLYKRVNVLNMNGNSIKEIDSSFFHDIRLVKLQLSRNLFSKVQKKDFIEFGYLTELDLSYNLINYVDPLVFEHNDWITILNLQGNPLKQIEGPFLHSRCLKKLNLASCSLRKLSPKFFVNIVNLHELDISNNPIYTLEPNTFNGIISLKYLNLNNCGLTYLSSEIFNNLEYLRTLRLAGNNFNSHVDWKSIMNKLHFLNTLDLTQSGIINLPENLFFNNSLLMSLILARNDLSLLDVSTILSHNLFQLYFIDLNACNLRKPLTKNAFLKLTHLHSLMLSGNYLSPDDLSVALSSISNLKNLTLRGCELTHLPKNLFNKCTKLRELDISRNPIHEKDLRNVLTPLNSLEYLNIGYMLIQNLTTQTLPKLLALKKLILSGNKFKSLDTDLFLNFPNLKVLELNNCNIYHLNGALMNRHVYYSNLEELRLSGNPLQVFQERPLFSIELSQLKYLDLSNCNLSYLSYNAFSTTPNIKHLILNKNELKGDGNSSLKFLEPLSALDQLDLSDNKITSVKPNKFIQNHQLQYLNLIGNPLICDCYIVDLWKWALYHRNKNVLVGFRQPVNSNENSKKTKNLECNFLSKFTPLEYLKNSSIILSSGPSYKWIWYLQEASCPS